MKQRKKKAPSSLDLPFAEALTRFIQTDPKELEELYDETRRAEEAAKRFIDEREQSIRKGARRAPKRFRL